MKVFIKILKIIAGIILGLVLSLITIVGLDAVFPKGNPFDKNTLNLWFIAPIVAGWLFLVLWLMLYRSPAKDLQTQGIEHLPKSISELVDGIIDAMQYRKSVRAEVRQELTDHFTDALTDCDDEQQKQQCIQELIGGFGDVKLLGTLLRRAKKRCRPLWRTMVVRAFQLIGICFVLLIAYIGWFFTGKPVVTTNYLEIVNQRVRPVAEDSLNAWPLYEQAAKSYIYPSKINMENPHSNEYPETIEITPGMLEEKKFDRSPRILELLSKQEQETLEGWMLHNQQPLELIRQGNQKPYYWQEYKGGDEGSTELISMLLPNLSEYKDMARLLCWQGLLNAQKGDYDKAFEDIFEAYLFGQNIHGRHTTLIERLVSMGIETTATKTLRIVLNEHGNGIEASVLDSARQRFSEMIKNEDFTMDFSGEKLFMYDEAQRCFTQSRFGKSHLYLPRLNTLGAGPNDEAELFLKYGLSILFTHPDKEETLREVERFYAEMEKMAAMTPASVKSQGFEMNEITEEIMEKNLFLHVLMPALGKVNLIAYRSRIDAEATLAILAIHQYQKQQGQLPESLQALVDKGLLREVPFDPFSDKPLVYRKIDDDFILYSVGYNCTDDGGAPGTDSKGRPRNWGENGDHVFWPVNSDI